MTCGAFNIWDVRLDKKNIIQYFKIMKKLLSNCGGIKKEKVAFPTPTMVIFLLRMFPVKKNLGFQKNSTIKSHSLRRSYIHSPLFEKPTATHLVLIQ